MPLNDPLIRGLESIYQARYEPNFAWKSVCSQFLALPGLRGFWPTSSMNSNGDCLDLGGNTRTLSRPGGSDIRYNVENLAPYILFPGGAGDWVTRSDDANLDISGTEAVIHNDIRGLTLGLWVWYELTTSGSTIFPLGKAGAGGNLQYYLQKRTDDTQRFTISTIGTNEVFVATPSAISFSQWLFMVGRFDPGVDLALFINGVKHTAATGSTSIFNGNGDFSFGAFASASTQILDGRGSCAFVCASALPDAIIGALYQNSRAMFGV